MTVVRHAAGRSSTDEMLDGMTEGEQYKAHAFAAFASNHES
jgi:hypothetical protein